MRLDVQWFFAGMIHEDIIDHETCNDVLRAAGEDADLLTVAQATLDIASQKLTEADATRFMSIVQQMIDYANEQAATGEPPPDRFVPVMESAGIDIPMGVPDSTLISKPAAQGWTGMPSFDSVKDMNEQQLRSFMLGLLKEVRERGASDLHLSALANPFVRHCGANKSISDYILTSEDALRLNTVLLDEAQIKSFNDNKDLNYPLAVDENNRLRVCLMQHKDGAAGSYRLISEDIMSLQELGFTEQNCGTIEHLLDYHNGLILVTGPIGSGKTTTLASLVNIVNSRRHDHVITVEDPIEIVQHSKNCNVTQREILTHTNSYKAALKGALREDPDVIIIGELHDLETIEMAITASETGHLVIGTLHTCDAANTLNRLLDVFPPTQQPQIRAMTAGSLRGIICQKLLPKVNGGMTVAAEILVNTTAVSNIISEGRTHHLRAVLQTGQNAGMSTMDTSVFELYKRGVIPREVAQYNIRARDIKDEFNRTVAIEEAKKLTKKK